MNTITKLGYMSVMLPNVMPYLALLQNKASVEYADGINAALSYSVKADNAVSYSGLTSTANDAVFKLPTAISESMPNHAIFGTRFPVLNYAKVLQLFQDWITTRTVQQVCIVNVHTLINSLKDQDLKAIFNQSLTTMDGVPLVWYSHLIHKSTSSTKVCGPDLMLNCLDHGREQGWKHFFLGNTDPVLTNLVTAMTEKYPGVEIAGCYSPPFRPLTAAEDQQLVDRINAAKPDILWVGLGAPKQEKWIAAHLHQINVPVQIGVGAAFSFHSGHVARAPRWMQKYGLEWVFRMLKERRLIKRYLTSNPVFLGLFLRDLILVRLLKLA